MTASKIVFRDHVFCFTGKLSDLKRSVAEREVRSRGGLTIDRINDRLNYLIVGDEASPAWKFGNYGRKIAEARELIASRASSLLMVSESGFMDALALTPQTSDGKIDGKVVVVKYAFLLPDGGAGFDAGPLERTVRTVAERFSCHASVRASWAVVRSDLFGEHAPSAPDLLAVECRFVRHQHLDAPVSDLVSFVETAFEALPEIDGKLRWFERVEGSASYVRLLAEVPQSYRVPGI